MITQDSQKLLLEICRQSIIHGLKYQTPLSQYPKNLPDELWVKRASFVTLYKRGELRGCVGVLEAFRPLVEDVAHNAFAAAFSDSRFSPLGKEEQEEINIHISILSLPTAIAVVSEEDLLSKIKQGTHGLILKEGSHRTTFLPSVWGQVRDKREFLTHLKNKAGLPGNYWSASLQFETYTTFSFGGITHGKK